SLDPNRGVSISSCAMDDFVDHTFWDVLAFNVYMYSPAIITHSLGYRGYLESLKKRYAPDKPFIVTEFGLPVSPSGPGKYGYGGNTEEEQRDGVLRMYRDLIDAGAVGGCVFAWIDEWWKAGNQSMHNDHPEEWYGVISIKLNDDGDIVEKKRPLYHALKKFHQALVIEPKNGKHYRGNVRIEVYAMDSVKKVNYKINKKQWKELKKKGHWWTGSFDSSTIKDGFYELEVRSYDKRKKLLKSIKKQIGLFNKNKEQLEAPYSVRITMDQKEYKTGGLMKGEIKVLDFKQDPVQDKLLQYSFFWPKNWQDRSYEKKTDKNGLVPFSFPLKYMARLDNITVSAGLQYMEGEKTYRTGDLYNVLIRDGKYAVKKRNINIYKKRSPVKIDGEIDQAWEKADRLIIRDIVDKVPLSMAGSWDGINDLSAEVRILYDKDNLYLLAEITDDIPAKNIQEGDRIWDGDGVEFYLSTDPSRIPNKGFSGWDYQVIIGANGNMWIYDQAEGGTRNQPPVNSDVKIRKLTDKYIMEVRLSLANFKDFGKKKRINIDIAVNDADKHNGREGQLIWNGKSDNWKNSVNWGVGILK
ncbi:MAG: hypothetical protein KKH98_10770, partial [Spirochaetes bacterium]|nr:hypothetical protein [Spirochaetota bacterium]